MNSTLEVLAPLAGLLVMPALELLLTIAMFAMMILPLQPLRPMTTLTISVIYAETATFASRACPQRSAMMAIFCLLTDAATFAWLSPSSLASPPLLISLAPRYAPTTAASTEKTTAM